MAGGPSSGFRLRHLGLGARLGITCFLLVLGGGYAAALAYLVEHYHNRDEQPELTLTDLEASYHGIEQRSALRDAVEGDHGREHAPDEAERQMLLTWLDAVDVGARYDAVNEQDLAPADVLDMRCAACHARNGDPAKIAAGEHSAQALDNWPDVEKVAFSRTFRPVSAETLVVSLHVHASMLPVIGLLVAGLCLLCGGSTGLKSLLVAGAGFGLLVDLGCMWLARSSAAFVPGIVIGGALFGLCLCLQLAWVLWELWLGRR